MEKNTVKNEIINATVEAIEKAKTAEELVSELNAKRATLTQPEIAPLTSAINEKLKAENGEAKTEYIKALLSTDKITMFNTFIDVPCYTVKRLTNDKDTGDFVLVDGKRQLNFAQLDSAYEKENDGNTLANAKNYHRMVANFTHNIGVKIAGDLSEDKDVKKVCIPVYQGEKETEVDFSKASITALETQLNAIVTTILPNEICAKMLRSDVRAICQAATQEKMLCFTLKNEIRILNSIFNAIRIRKNNEAYTLESKAKCHKESKNNA